MPFDPSAASKKRPPSTHGSRAYVLKSEKAAIAVGLVATVVGAWLVIRALAGISDVIQSLLFLLFTVYLIIVAIRFWVGKSYLGGMTVDEVIEVLAWPFDAVRKAWQGYKVVVGERETVTRVRNGRTVINQQAARYVGYAFVAIALAFGFVAVIFTPGLISSLLHLAFVVWIIGAVCEFWLTGLWCGGLTRGDVVMTLFWPVVAAKLIKVANREDL